MKKTLIILICTLLNVQAAPDFRVADIYFSLERYDSAKDIYWQEYLSNSDELSLKRYLATAVRLRDWTAILSLKEKRFEVVSHYQAYALIQQGDLLKAWGKVKNSSLPESESLKKHLRQKLYLEKVEEIPTLLSSNKLFDFNPLTESKNLRKILQGNPNLPQNQEFIDFTSPAFQIYNNKHFLQEYNGSEKKASFFSQANRLRKSELFTQLIKKKSAPEKIFALLAKEPGLFITYLKQLSADANYVKIPHHLILNQELLQAYQEYLLSVDQYQAFSMTDFPWHDRQNALLDQVYKMNQAQSLAAGASWDFYLQVLRAFRAKEFTICATWLSAYSAKQIAKDLWRLPELRDLIYFIKAELAIGGFAFAEAELYLQRIAAQDPYFAARLADLRYLARAEISYEKIAPEGDLFLEALLLRRFYQVQNDDDSQKVAVLSKLSESPQPELKKLLIRILRLKELRESLDEKSSVDYLRTWREKLEKELNSSKKAGE